VLNDKFLQDFITVLGETWREHRGGKL